MYFLLIFTAIMCLIIWKIIYDFSIIFLGIPLGLIFVFFGFFFKEESPLGGIFVMLLGVAAIVLSIINRDLSIGIFVDSIPDMIMFWK